MQSIERAVLVLAASTLASLALAVAGCGGDSTDPGVAQAPTTTTKPSQSGGSTTDDPVAFSACMRSHGVPDFPDPKVASDGGVITMVPKSDSPRFTAALKACRRFLGSGDPSPEEAAQEQVALLKFAACMRSHGVPDFPDPTVSGGRATLPPGRIDRGSPRFGAAKKACRQSLARVTGG